MKYGRFYVYVVTARSHDGCDLLVAFDSEESAEKYIEEQGGPFSRKNQTMQVEKIERYSFSETEDL